MSDIVDLFGDPVPSNHGARGRPAHAPSRASRDKVNLLLALGWSNERIANAIGVSAPTLRKCYRGELKTRLLARDRLDARVAEKLFEGVNAGNVGAVKEFRKLVERNDQMEAARSFDRPTAQAAKPKAEKLGKKEAARKAAETAGADSEWGSDLMFPGSRPN